MGRHGHARSHENDSDRDSSRSTSSSTDDGGDDTYSSDSGDDRDLIPKTGSRSRGHHGHKKHHATAAAHSHGEMTMTAVIVAVVAVVLLLGAYWVYTKNGGTLFPSSGSTSSSGSEGTGSSGGAGSAGAGSGWTGTGAASGGQGGSGSATSSSGTKSGGAGGGGSTGAGSAGASSTSSGAATSETGASTPGAGGGGGKVTAFFENWKGVDPASVDFSGLHVAFWFTAVPETSGSIDIGESVAGQAKTFAEAAKKAGAKPMLTVGGWSGSAPFSKLVSSEDSRKTFVEAMVEAMEDNSFEGLDIDWEYPGAAGATEDFDLANDLSNLLLLLQEIREKIGNDKLISMDTSSGVYKGADGQPSTDMSEFGKTLDFITIMTYDATTYSSKTTGPNFAFSSKCAPATGTFELPTAVQAWIDAKFPADKISIGLASYGYAWEVSDFKDGGGVDGASSSIYQTSSKVLDVKDGSLGFDKIVSDYLDKMDYTFDDCTSTPFLYSKDTKLFIAYDDEKSFGVKGGYAKEHGLMGCSVYAGLTQDSDRKLLKAAIDAC